MPSSASTAPHARCPTHLTEEVQLTLSFDRGTLVLEGTDRLMTPEATAAGTSVLSREQCSELEKSLTSLPGLIWDRRVARYRAPAWRYLQLRSALAQRPFAVTDEVARGLTQVCPHWHEHIELRPYQSDALMSWTTNECRGVVALPTGSGKTRLAVAAMAATGARTLCLVPTRVLLHQWHAELSRWYAGAVGVWGDGVRHLEAITVATFESALRYAPLFGGQFELLVVDEVHHFGNRQKDEALEMCVAPKRLGLTATPSAEERQVRTIEDLVGPVVYESSIAELAGSYLANFELIVLRVSLNREERQAYAEEQAAFQPFFRAFRRGDPAATWIDFMKAASRTAEGRRALAAWHRCRRIVAYPTAKQALVANLLERHRNQRTLVFTSDNDTAYEVARTHLVMPLTCDIKRSERDRALELFREGRLGALVSSRVLNEGLDVPDADVGIVVGGTHGEREHVQRVGRLLRPSGDKRAVIYELVVTQSNETWASARRRRALEGHMRRPR